MHGQGTQAAAPAITRRRLCLSGAAGIVLVGCAGPRAVDAPLVEVPIYPPPPAPPRFIYERSIYSSAILKPETERDGFRRFVTGEGRTGVGMSKPYGVAVRHGRVYVTDTVRRSLLRFDFQTGQFSEVGLSDIGALHLPTGVDIDPAGNVFVADSSSRTLQIYDPTGRHLRTLPVADHLTRPAGIACDRDGRRVFVVDIGVRSDWHGVKVFDAITGELLQTIGRRGAGDGEFNLPRDVAIDPAGRIFVVDGGNFRVQVFDPEGRFLRRFGQVGRMSGTFSRPKEIAIDAQSHAYVVDSAFGNMQIFNEDGKLLLDVGGRGERDGPGRFMLPSGIAVDADGRVYMVDQYFRKVDVFRPVGLALTDGHLGAYAESSAERRLARQLASR